MRSAHRWLGAALTSTLLGSLAHAQYQAPASPAPANAATPYPTNAGTPYPAYAGTVPYRAPMPYAQPYPGYPARVAPDMCNPGWWGVNQCGAPYGPNHCVYPPFPPYNGERPPIPGKSPAFMTHPFAHGPRDFFMLD